MLLAAQLLQVLAYPFLGGSKTGGAVIGVIGMLAVGSAVLAVRRTPNVSRVVFFLGAPTIVFTLLEAIFADSDPIVLVSGLLHAPFYFYVSYAMLRYLFHDDEVTTDEYYATGAAFTVVAWGFAYLFAAVQVVWPDSYSQRRRLRPLVVRAALPVVLHPHQRRAVRHRRRRRTGARDLDGGDDGRRLLRRDGRVPDGRADHDAPPLTAQPSQPSGRSRFGSRDTTSR